MPLKRTRGLVDFICAALCVWAATYRTPAGALVRTVAARLTHTQTTAAPLLSYFSGGDEQPFALPFALPPTAVPPDDALGYGAYAAWSRLPSEERAAVAPWAPRYGVAVTELADPQRGPRAFSRLVHAASRDSGGPELAVAALFTGADAAEYARERIAAAGGPPTLEAAVLELPPRFEGALRHASEALTLGTAYGLSWPVARATPITSPFGYRNDPLTGGRSLHAGIDLAVSEGTPVAAVAPGVVRRASEDGLCGLGLVIDHGHGVRTAYCHNAELKVSVGQRVERGEIISLSGNTGHSTGPHLHYQLELGQRPVDPLGLTVTQASGR